MRLVGTDLVQAVPLVLGTVLGSMLTPRVPQSIIRRGIVVVLTMSGVALLDKAGWAPLGAGAGETYPLLVVIAGLVMVVLVPLAWALVRHATGLPAFGRPTLAELEDPTYRPGGWRPEREAPAPAGVD